MNADKRCRQLIEILLNQEGSKYTDSHLRLAYERGYLTGLLAKLMYEDEEVFQKVLSKLKND